MNSTRFSAIPAVHLFLMRDDEVLLLMRENTGFHDGNYSVIAGHLDGGERVIDALIREAPEEAGITLAGADITMAGVKFRHDEWFASFGW